jgi:hypothetical protein
MMVGLFFYTNLGMTDAFVGNGNWYKMIKGTTYYGVQISQYGEVLDYRDCSTLPAPTPTPAPTATPNPTLTPTPDPTSTPIPPTATPTPTPPPVYVSSYSSGCNAVGNGDGFISISNPGGGTGYGYYVILTGYSGNGHLLFVNNTIYASGLTDGDWSFQVYDSSDTASGIYTVTVNCSGGGEQP